MTRSAPRVSPNAKGAPSIVEDDVALLQLAEPDTMLLTATTVTTETPDLELQFAVLHTNGVPIYPKPTFSQLAPQDDPRLLSPSCRRSWALDRLYPPGGLGCQAIGLDLQRGGLKEKESRRSMR